MSANITTVIEKIVNIPLDFYSVKTKSWNTLLLESGYFEVHELIAEHEIIEILKKHPHLIAEWLQWSDNQRCTPTWYFTKDTDGKCFVGHSPEINEFKEINTANEFEACAFFIKKLIKKI